MREQRVRDDVEEKGESLLIDSSVLRPAAKIEQRRTKAINPANAKYTVASSKGLFDSIASPTKYTPCTTINAPAATCENA